MDSPVLPCRLHRTTPLDISAHSQHIKCDGSCGTDDLPLFGSNPHFLYGPGTYLPTLTTPYLCRAARCATGRSVGIYEVYENGLHGVFTATDAHGVTTGDWCYAPGASDAPRLYPSFGIRPSLMSIGRNEAAIEALEEKVERQQIEHAKEMAALRADVAAIRSKLGM